MMSERRIPFDLDVQPKFGRLKGTLGLPDRPMRLSELAWNAMQLDEQLIAMAIRRDTKEGANKISCAKGCSACCYHPVPVSPPEAWMIADLVASFPHARRTTLLERFARTSDILQQRGLDGRTVVREQLGQFGLEYFELRIPCAFLEDDACSIHPDRPSICREFLATTPAVDCADLRKKEVRSVPLAAHLTQCLSKLAAEMLGGEPIAIPLHEAFAWAREHEEDGKRTWAPSVLMGKLVEIVNASRTSA
jgi:Fe-S-cluster containining protein